MATELSNAWNSLQSGDYGNAQQAFRSAVRSESNKTYGFLGLAATSLALGNLRDASSFAEKSLEESHTPEAHLMLGEVHSRLGNRREAEEQIDEYFSGVGEKPPYALALRGEQRIRTARWDEGIDDYLEALERDTDGRAYAQLQRVMTDLVKAVNQGKLPAEPAEQFVNQINYKCANPPEGASSFFGKIRRALESGSSVSDPPGQDPIFDFLSNLDLTESSGGGGFTSMTGSSASQPSGSETGPPDESESSSEEKTGIDPKQKNLARVIQGDRSKNEQLQETIGQMQPPDWPSSPEYGEIDPVESLAWENQSIYANEPGMDATDFRITSGSVRSEIFLERCLQNLLKGAKKDRAVSLRFRPEAITRIEVNCWDGLLERLPDLSPIYDEFHEADKYQELALGRFLGECVAVPYDGTWDFAEPPEDSKLVVGNQTLDPLGLAGRWVAADNPDDVDLEVIADQARKAAEQSLSLTIEQDYIDPTREVEGQSLNVKLAEMWARYLFRLADSSFADLAETVETLEVEPDAIVFEIAADLCPKPARGPNDSAMRENGRVAVAYLRERGEFLLMASRKHAARAAQASFGTLDADRAGDVVQFLADYHRPSWVWIGNSDIADRLQSSVGTSLSAPVLGGSQAEPTLEVMAVTGSHKAVTLRLVAPSDSSQRWRLKPV